MQQGWRIRLVRPGGFVESAAGQRNHPVRPGRSTHAWQRAPSRYESRDVVGFG